MADTKISGLPNASTPLSGAEVLPIVQSGATKQVSVANLTDGRSLAATGATFSTGQVTVNNLLNAAGNFNVKGQTEGNLLFANASLNAVGFGTSIPAALVHIGGNVSAGRPTYGGQQLIFSYQTTSDATQGLEFQGRGDGGGFGHRIYHLSNNGELVIEGRQASASWTEVARYDANSNYKVTSGNIVVGTAGKSIEFAGNGGVIWRVGAGSPESAVTAPVGSLYTRTDGGANTTLYIKESGAGNTGWVAK